MTLFEGVCIGFAMGVVATLISIGVMFYGMDKAEHDGDSDIRIYKPSNDRNHRGMDRFDKRGEKE